MIYINLAIQLIIIIYFIFKINQSSISNLENRINCYIFPERAQKTIRAQNRFKNQFSSRLEQKNLELQQLMNFAEFSDLFSITLTAGQNPRAGLEKICPLISKNLSKLLNKSLEDNLYGKPLFLCLREMTSHKDAKGLKPLIQQIEIGIQRGTPLSEIAREFANEQRNKLKNLLTKQAANKEVAMLLPVVFVVLPSVLAVAMYPALTVLQQLG